VFDELTSLKLPFCDVSECVNGRNNLRKLGIDGRLTLKLILQDYDVRVCLALKRASGTLHETRGILDQLSKY
jgi:hypothetical protein